MTSRACAASAGIRKTAAALLIDTEGRLLLQRRDNIPSILYPGKVGLFGGHLEGEETFLQCVCREVQEEISYRVPEETFRQLGWYRGVHPDGVGTVCGLYLAREIPVDALTITEGSLVIVSPNSVAALIEQMSPTALAAVEMFTTSQ